MKIALIMLAAGNSRRFGENKLVYPIEGKPMYTYILETLLSVKKHMEDENLHLELTVVTQYDSIGTVAQNLGAKVYYNPHPEEGISSSIQIGVKGNLQADACLFTVSDQPWLTEGTIRTLVDAYGKDDRGIACVKYEHKLGNPCIFSQKYYPELLALNGDIGGKHVISGHREDTLTISVHNPKELEDMDHKK